MFCAVILVLCIEFCEHAQYVRYPAAPIKESTLLVNSPKIGSYDYLSK